jgi:nucleotide-binding universal stress UspA family protein
MYRSILVPLDGSPFSEYALPMARSLALQSGAALHLALVHVPVTRVYVETGPIVDDVLDAETRARQAEYLRRVSEHLRADGEIEATATILDGPVVEALVDEATRHSCDLIVMTTHGRGGFQRLWLGSVADSLVHHSTLPIILLRPQEGQPALDAQPQINRILIPLDGSPLAEEILTPALELARITHVPCTLLQVVEPWMLLDAVSLRHVPAPDHPIPQQRKQEAQTYLEQIAARPEATGLTVETHVVVDERVAPAILAEAQQSETDLIAMATHGRSGLARFRVGSIADKVLRGADHAVLLLRPSERAAG